LSRKRCRSIGTTRTISTTTLSFNLTKRDEVVEATKTWDGGYSPEEEFTRFLEGKDKPLQPGITTAREALSPAQIARFLGSQAQKVKVLHNEFVGAIPLDNVAIYRGRKYDHQSGRRAAGRGIYGILGPSREVVCGHWRNAVLHRRVCKLGIFSGRGRRGRAPDPTYGRAGNKLGRAESVDVYLTGVHLIGVHLMGVYLMNVHLTGVQLIGGYLMSVLHRRVYSRLPTL
jgi:hypothetical protein